MIAVVSVKIRVASEEFEKFNQTIVFATGKSGYPHRLLSLSYLNHRYNT